MKAPAAFVKSRFIPEGEINQRLNHRSMDATLELASLIPIHEGRGTEMTRYMIQTSHAETHADCERFKQSMLQAGAHFVARAEWGS